MGKANWRPSITCVWWANGSAEGRLRLLSRAVEHQNQRQNTDTHLEQHQISRRGGLSNQPARFPVIRVDHVLKVSKELGHPVLSEIFGPAKCFGFLVLVVERHGDWVVGLCGG